MSETMTPKELMELADSLESGPSNSYDTNNAIAALRSYAELVAALEWLDAQPHTGIEYSGHESQCTPEAAVWLAKKLGWPGLEEL